MPLSPGSRLGPYEIVAPLGAGGMGEVYRARDTRLGREVAVKVLPQHLSASPELRARFEREARSVSRLNHPHICVLHDVGLDGDTAYLVLELVEGETLGARLARGPLPTAEVLRIGSEVASALDRAHRAGIIHRDLKPGNIMLTRSGSKLMDFGLARAAAGPVDSGSHGGMTQSPTVAEALTGEGRIVGTFQYMSPEQLESKDADARSDLWALGCVLYEMTTGKRPFGGESAASLIGSIMKDPPAPLAERTPMAPAALDRLVRRCLAKDPEDRWQTARDVFLELRWIAESATQTGSTPSPVPAGAGRRPPRERLIWSAAVLALLLVVAFLSLEHGSGGSDDPGPAGRFLAGLPPGLLLERDPSGVSVSPDGRFIAFVATDSTGLRSVWLRPLDAMTARPLTGAELDILYPFWSPDSRHVGFFKSKKLYRAPVGGGPPEFLCDAAFPRGASWGSAGAIVFAPAAEGPIYRVDEAGGTPVQVTNPDSARDETGHRWPCFLPDGKHFVYVAVPSKEGNFDVYLGSIDGGAPRRLFAAGSSPVFAAPGHLVYLRDDALLALPFDPKSKKVGGAPRTLGSLLLVTEFTGSNLVSASARGTLVHLSSRSANSEIVRFDRRGRVLEKLAVPPGRYEGLALSPDGTRLAVERRTGPTTKDLWLVDIARGVSTRFTFGERENFAPAWSPDGRTIAFGSNRGGRENIYARSVMTQAPETLVHGSSALFKHPSGWTPDGKQIVLEEMGDKSRWDIFILPLEPGSTPRLYLDSPFDELVGLISPDGRWMAYISRESGQTELYVDSFPAPGNKIQVSTEGALVKTGPRFATWCKGGRELVFEEADHDMVAVEVETEPVFRASAPRVLFRMHPDALGGTVSGDGEQVFATLPAGGRETSIEVVTNWTGLLGKEE